MSKKLFEILKVHQETNSYHVYGDSVEDIERMLDLGCSFSPTLKDTKTISRTIKEIEE